MVHCVQVVPACLEVLRVQLCPGLQLVPVNPHLQEPLPDPGLPEVLHRLVVQKALLALLRRSIPGIPPVLVYRSFQLSLDLPPALLVHSDLPVLKVRQVLQDLETLMVPKDHWDLLVPLALDCRHFLPVQLALDPQQLPLVLNCLLVH